MAQWMRQHLRYKRPTAWRENPPTAQPCQHKQSEWFCLRFNPDSPESLEYFRSARDAGDDWSADPLNAMCQGATDSFDLPTGDRHGSELYQFLLHRPSMYMCHHNPASGGFYVRFGCSNCSSMTDFYSPQYDLPPGHVAGKGKARSLKAVEEVRTAFRVFIRMILNWDEGRVIPHRCRHRHRDDPPPAPPPALANQPHW